MAERAHLFNETLRCREKKGGGDRKMEKRQKDGKEAGTESHTGAIVFDEMLS